MNAKSNFLKKTLFAVLTMVCAVAFNSTAGAACAAVVGVPVGAGAVAGNVVAMLAGYLQKCGLVR